MAYTHTHTHTHTLVLNKLRRLTILTKISQKNNLTIPTKMKGGLSMLNYGNNHEVKYIR